MTTFQYFVSTFDPYDVLQPFLNFVVVAGVLGVPFALALAFSYIKSYFDDQQEEAEERAEERAEKRAHRAYVRDMLRQIEILD